MRRVFWKRKEGRATHRLVVKVGLDIRDEMLVTFHLAFQALLVCSSIGPIQT